MKKKNKNSINKKVGLRNLDPYIGRKLKMLRLSYGMTQKEFSSIVSISFQQLQKYEKGSSRISVSRLCQFAEALNVSIQFFLEGADLKSNKSDYEKEFQENKLLHKAIGNMYEDRMDFKYEENGDQRMENEQEDKVDRIVVEIKDRHLKKSLLNLIKSLNDAVDHCENKKTNN